MISPQPSAPAQDRPRGAGSRRPVVHVSVASTASGDNEHYIFSFLESLFRTTQHAPFDLRVTAVDNSPGSGLGRRLRQRFPAISVTENATRRGHSANHNSALADSDADYFLVANDDIEFTDGALERAVRYLEDSAHVQVGVIAFNLRNPDGTLQHSTYSFPTIPRALLDVSDLRHLVPISGWTMRLAGWLGRGAGRSRFWGHDRTVGIDTFRGALVLARASAAREVGPMEEISLLGGEDADWNRRFWDRGWAVVFLREAQVIHHGHQTVKGNPKYKPEYLKGTLNYFRKHRSPAAFHTLRALALPVLLGRFSWYAATGNPPMRESMRECLRVVRTFNRSRTAA